jgi:hypothetical protein
VSLGFSFIISSTDLSAIATMWSKSSELLHQVVPQ